MIKNILGSWGANLGDDDYACALAALGVLESSSSQLPRESSRPSELASTLSDEFAHGQRTPLWREAKELDANTTIASWRETVHSDPAALAAGWREFRQRLGPERELPRIGIPLSWCNYQDLINVDDLCSWLQRADGLNALVMATPESGPEAVPWHWPLRVGVPEGPEHAVILDRLRAAQDRGSWVKNLARCFTVGSSRDTCDLLILSPRAARRPEQLPGSIRASFVACLEEAPLAPSLLGDHNLALYERLQAAGVAAVGPLDRQLENWFIEVLRQASHDVPIHGALWRVGRNLFGRNTLVVGQPPALDACRILAIAERQDRIVASLTSLPTDDRLVTASGPEEELTFGGVPTASAAPPLSGLQPSLATDLRDRMFTSERVDGERVVTDLQDRARQIDEVRAPRWIQADAWRPDAPALSAPSLSPGNWNVLAVHIGPSEKTRSDPAFPDSRLDFAQGDVALNVQIELAGAVVKKLDSPPGETAAFLVTTAARLAAPAPGGDDADIAGIDSSQIFLPPAGNSTRAWFAVYPHKRAGQIEGRICIIHNNRVLQTARLSTEIDANHQRGEGVLLRTEAVIHPIDEDPGERRAYHVAIQVSDVGGKLHLTIDQNGHPVTVRLDDLSDPISRISLGLAGAANKWDFKKPMFEQPVFAESLFTLAAAGAELEQHLRKKVGNGIDGWERIHLVPSTNEFFPLEYVYDGPPPAIGAKACPNLLGALDRGSCNRAMGTPGAPISCPNQRDKSFLCPMHFWGFRKLIERNGAVGAPDPTLPGVPPALAPQPICVPGKRAYCRVNALLFAASNRTFLYAPDPLSQAAERTGLVTSLRVLSGMVSDASDWSEWRREVLKKPNLLVLIAHTDEHLNTPVLEIGEGKMLTRPEILNDVSGAAGEPQLLILLGCSAADVTENFQPYPERFRDAGVSIVLAPVAPIRGADAVPIAKQLAQLLAEHLGKRDATAFGELLPLLRRRLLHDGHPGVMGIVGFGDGDWQLGGEPC